MQQAMLLTQYFPYASHQVLILSTDTEIDQSSFQQLHPALAHSYRLDFDPVEYSTKVSSGYWWNGSHEA
jgi:DNA sulfur modification protein DndD